MNKQQKMVIVTAIAVVTLFFILLKPVLFPSGEDGVEFETTANPKEVYLQALKEKKPIFLKFYSPG
ncbi:hypothetical protein M1M92_05130 [Peptococcaceae bacterium]|nr:hypothetical protein [Peptococcaceae bacterium]